MDIGKVGLTIVGGIILYLIGTTIIGEVIVGTTASDELISVILPLVIAGGLVIAVLVALMKRTGSGE